MSKFIEILKVALALLPAILRAVKEIEEAIPVAKQGEVKAKLLQGTVDLALGDAVDTAPTSSMVAKIGSLAVTAYKTVGLFK